MIGFTSTTAETTTAEDPDALVVAITETIAAKRGVSPTDLPPLNDYVDVDALASLFPSGPDKGASFGYVRFDTERYEVQVNHDGTIEVRSLDERAPNVECRDDRNQ